MFEIFFGDLKFIIIDNIIYVLISRFINKDKIFRCLNIFIIDRYKINLIINILIMVYDEWIFVILWCMNEWNLIGKNV